MSGWSIADKVVLITGGNTGIGKAAAIELARRGANVIFTSRDEQKGKAAEREIADGAGRGVTCLSLDLASFDSIRQLAAQVMERFPALHVLINNAGLILSERRETEQGFETTLGVNHVGHFLLTKLLLDRIVASAPARIINVSSRAHFRAPFGLDFEDLQARRRYQSMLVYARSKLANIYFTRELARRLAASGVTVNAVHPGLVGSDFAAEGDTKGMIAVFYRLAKPLMLTSEQGAETIVYCATAPELESVSGEYFANNKRGLIAPVAKNDAHAARLWELSERWIQQGRP